MWDRYDRRTDPIKNRVKGFLGGVSEHRDLLARSVASCSALLLLPFPLPLFPQMRLLSPASNCAWFVAGLSDCRVCARQASNREFQVLFNFLLLESCFLSSNCNEKLETDDR